MKLRMSYNFSERMSRRYMECVNLNNIGKTYSLLWKPVSFNAYSFILVSLIESSGLEIWNDFN